MNKNIACVLTHWFTGSLPFPPRATLAAGSLSGAGFLLVIVGSAVSHKRTVGTSHMMI